MAVMYELHGSPFVSVEMSAVMGGCCWSLRSCRILKQTASWAIIHISTTSKRLIDAMYTKAPPLLERNLRNGRVPRISTVIMRPNIVNQIHRSTQGTRTHLPLHDCDGMGDTKPQI